MADRGALLKQIQKGKKLKKAETNDRSKPQVGASGGGGGGGGPPMGGMALPRPPMPPPSGGGRSSAGGAAPAPPPPSGPPAGMPGLGGLFAGGMPTLKHRAGGVSTGRGDAGGSSSNGSVPVSAPPPPPATQKSPTKSKFSFPFGRSSHARSSSSSNGAPPPPPAAAPPPPPSMARIPPPPPSSGPPALPGRRLSDAGPPAFAPPVPPTGRLPQMPPASAPASRPGSAIPGKRAPPPPPTSRKPQIKPKPPGLTSNRHSTSPSPSPSSVPSTADMRSHLRPAAATTQNTPRPSAAMQPRNSQDDGNDSGIIAESQGSVSSLAGIFGKSVRAKGTNHSRSLTETMFNRTESPPAPARPPAPPNAAYGDRFSHQRTSSGSAPSHPPPPPPPPPPANAGSNGTAGVPVREGKWSFHAISDLPQPPQMSISRHKYPSGNPTGSAVALDI